MIKRLAALVIPLLVLAAGPATADDGWKRRHHDRQWHGYDHHRRGSASIVFWSGPVYRPYYRPYYPPRVVYAPPPVVYAPAPAPVVYAPAVSAAPMRDFRDDAGRYCREYQRTAIIDGREQPVYGTACLMPDGAWRIVSE
jgi:hypothetical protein